MPLAISAVSKNPEAASKGALVRAFETVQGRLRSMRGAWEEGKKVMTYVAEEGAITGVQTIGFAGLFYLSRKRKYQGKRNTFDKKGKINAYFWPGLVLSIVGLIPIMGTEHRLVPGMIGGLGKAAMFVGMTDALDKAAAEAAAKK
jgi:hypothetical protein